MSSAQLSTLTNLQLNDYATLAILTTIGYDYILTFSDEVEYIWNHHRTPVSTLFIFVRYLGILNVISCTLLGSSFLPGLEKSYVLFLPLLSRLTNTVDVCPTVLQGEVVYIINAWVFFLFLGAADGVMSLRVWAMYGRSRLILGTLLAIFILDIVSFLVRAAMNSDPKVLSTPVVRIVDDSFCSLMITSAWATGGIILQMIYGAALCLLVVVQFVRQLIQMYRATKQWQSNRYINLLVKEGIIYFFAFFMYDVISLLGDLEKLPAGGWQLVLVLVLNYVPVFTLTPRFIINIRALYARDVKARCGEGIDTGFGLSVSRSAGNRSALVFADVEQDQELEEAVVEEVCAVQAA